MNSATYPLRFRLRGGRNIHAVRYTSAAPPFAACGQIVGDADDRQHEGATVTCSACNKVLAKASA